MEIFKFKQFSVDQSGCAMKINTDGVLLGALAEAENPRSILDIGTGTGVISLMIAQRFIKANIDAVEIDPDAAATARLNFSHSNLNERLNLFSSGFYEYLVNNPDRKYDLIVSNPPFHIYSLQSAGVKKNLARHADKAFFEQLINKAAQHLTDKGTFWMVLPLQTADLVKHLAKDNGFFVQQIIHIKSYPDSPPHREIIALGQQCNPIIQTDLIIYDEPKVYSEDYRYALKEFLTIF
ncbi:tRNA1(Val) (adenine(37)-N6)-methyltransferase [Mucilaginibacter segetis]|uniref:tRNA1(Val) (adenine(37)-N6)-methyltransferase n=1 Tax=Mucilaginibacter segetis TaxID=2793071 RepID=A0A934PX43_9SPHI|nr:methyltransferase [Mucilaginibacter segetis]MBK0381076.1 methyltransferase [Mucilaginibacter segetis]